jgi:4-hydroxy-tetrahydrodipicolinate synthase
MRFEGIYTPVVTPYREDFSIDEAPRQVIEHLIAAGVHGIIVAGTTGEYYAQTPEERIALMPFVQEAIAGRVPLIVGTGAIRTEDSIAYAEAAKADRAPMRCWWRRRPTPARRGARSRCTRWPSTARRTCR